MMRTTQALAAICAALVLASCGGDEGEPIPESNASRLEALLDQVQRQSDRGSCVTLLETTIPALEQRAEDLPDSVGSDTRETITDGVAHLRDLAETDCAEKQQEELPPTEQTTTSETTTPETTTSETTKPETTTSETTAPETTTTETTPETTTPPETPPGEGGTPPGQGGTPPGQPRRGDQAGRSNGDDGGDDG